MKLWILWGNVRHKHSFTLFVNILFKSCFHKTKLSVSICPVHPYNNRLKKNLTVGLQLIDTIGNIHIQRHTCKTRVTNREKYKLSANNIQIVLHSHTKAELYNHVVVYRYIKPKRHKRPMFMPTSRKEPIHIQNALYIIHCMVNNIIRQTPHSSTWLCIGFWTESYVFCFENKIFLFFFIQNNVNLCTLSVWICVCG
jgi:hypothetical protein